MKSDFPLLFFLAAVTAFLFSSTKRVDNYGVPEFHIDKISDASGLTLRKGDILVRPNWGWLPGSCSVKDGRKYGHAAIVTEDATGNTIEEALSKASVVEALFFDQGTRQFQFNKRDQIRERKAIISFGNRFKGIRYRLRMPLTDDQRENIVKFLRNQLDGGYNILSSKIKFKSESEQRSALISMKNSDWHCATLIWEAYYLSTNTDIDANGGVFIYPADIIAAKPFELPDGRICF